MRDARVHLDGLARLHRLEGEERRAEFRQCFATLAAAAATHTPVPLEGLDPAALHDSVKAARESHLLDDLGWLRADHALGALYELGAALPPSDEKRELGRRVLRSLNEGDASTFVLVGTLLAQSSRRGLSGPAIRARVALALDLPIGIGVSADALALALIARTDLEEEWLSVPSTGSLPSRRLAARLVERAAREAARRVDTGDESVLSIFERHSVIAAWNRLLKDREPLVWHHIAVARGLLSAIVPRLDAEMGEALSPDLTPTEWRRAAASMAASIAVDPERAIRRCGELLSGELMGRDPGLASAMILGLARAAEAEPDAAEELLTTLVQQGGLDALEALVELREEQLSGDFGDWAARLAIARLNDLNGQSDDDGQEALIGALADDLRMADEIQRRATLRERIGAARDAFATDGSRAAHAQATQIVEAVDATLDRLENASPDTTEGRKQAFLALRELDLALLETSTLVDLLMLGAKADETSKGKSPAPLRDLHDCLERLQAWLFLREREPIAAGDTVQHRTLRVRRLRALLHLVDADTGEEKGSELRERRLRGVRVLLARARDDAPSPLRRIVHAAAARACEAMLRDDIGDLSDLLLTVVTHLRSEDDLTTFAEASMMPETELLFRAYASLIERTERGARVTQARSRAGQDALRVLVRHLPAAAGPRVEALRRALLSLTAALDSLALAGSLTELAGEHGQTSKLAPLGEACEALARIVEGARRRLGEPRADAPACGAALRFVDLAVLHAVRGNEQAYVDAVASVVDTLREDLPFHVAEAVCTTLVATVQLPVLGDPDRVSAVPLLKKRDRRAELPPWMPPSRTLGGFFVLRALGSGAGGSVFIARRSEERANEYAPRFALKVPEYGGTAARTLSEEQFHQLFREEAGALLQVPVHPNLARLVTFDAGARPKPILVMELVEGPSLERIKETAGLDMPRAITVLDGVARGLHAMHEIGVGHLDVKPSNVILNDPDGPGPALETPVLVDFGLAGRNVRPGCATANYGAPEVWGLVPKGHVPSPMAVDVYAYGCLAFEVLTGKELFDGVNEMAILGMHLQHDGDALGIEAMALVPELAPIAEVLRGALRLDPRKRTELADVHAGLMNALVPLEGARWPLLQ